MNVTNVKATLKSSIQSSITSNDLTAQPLDIDRTVTELATKMATEEHLALQKAKDLAAQNANVRKS